MSVEVCWRRWKWSNVQMPNGCSECELHGAYISTHLNQLASTRNREMIFFNPGFTRNTYCSYTRVYAVVRLQGAQTAIYHQPVYPTPPVMQSWPGVQTAICTYCMMFVYWIHSCNGSWIDIWDSCNFLWRVEIKWTSITFAPAISSVSTPPSVWGTVHENQQSLGQIATRVRGRLQCFGSFYCKNTCSRHAYVDCMFLSTSICRETTKCGSPVALLSGSQLVTTYCNQTKYKALTLILISWPWCWSGNIMAYVPYITCLSHVLGGI